MSSNTKRILKIMDIFINNNEQLQLLCRVCLIENPKQSKSLFEMVGSRLISEKMMLCSKVRIHNSDGLPGIICDRCSKELEAADSFRVKCEYSDSLLRKFYINGVLNKTEEPQINMPIFVKQEIVPCKQCVKFENEEDVGSDTSGDVLCNGFSSEIAHSKIKKIVEQNINVVKNVKMVSRLIMKPTESCTIADNKTSVVKLDGDNTWSVADEKKCEINAGQVRIKPFSCNICNKSLTSKKSLERHITCLHSQENNQRKCNITGFGVNKRFHCMECPYTTPRRQALEYHLRTHTGERPYKCDVCDARFSQPGSLFSHSKIHSDKIYYTCSECGKGFKLKHRFEKHKLVHSTEKNHICIICKKAFKAKIYLEKHLDRHRNIRNYSCDTCGAAFVSLPELINHSKKHSTLKKFECSICQFRTRLKPTLKKHIMRHTGEKNFKCVLCKFSAFAAGSLRVHMRKHTREKKFSCPVCDMKMIHSSSINRHMMRAHGIKYVFNDHTDRRVIK